MDTSDSSIVFNELGVCSHCLEFDAITRLDWFPNDDGRQKWLNIVRAIKRAGKGQEYDCILGLSGGVDSSYLALKAKEWGLRPLVVHVDAGWNSELAVANIEAIVKHCNYDLYTQVIDWEEMRDLQLAYLEAGVANQDVPQDHAFFASLYHYAAKNNIRYILSGGNLATESIFPKSWHGSAMDAENLLAIHKSFGKVELSTYPTISFFQYYFWYPFVRKIKAVRPLNFMPYNKAEAEDYLIKTIGYKSYGRKHGESLFTKVFQNYYLPKKFGYDKRRPHLSSLIMSNQITRQDALKKLNDALYDERELENDLNYFCKKMRISRGQLESYISSINRFYYEFCNWDKKYLILKKIQKLVGNVLGKKIKPYS